MKAIDRYTVEITPDWASIDFLKAFTTPYLAPLDWKELGKHVTPSDPLGHEWLKSNVATYRPFVLDNADSNRIVLKARPAKEYWGKLPAVKTFIIVNAPEEGARLQLVLSGAADGAERAVAAPEQHCPEGQADDVPALPDARHIQRGDEHERGAVQRPRGAAGDRACDPVRHDPEDGLPRLGDRSRSLLPPLIPGATTKYWHYETDAAAAEAVLSKVSGTQTLRYQLATQGADQIAILIQKALQDAGMKVELQGVEATEFRARAARGEFPFIVTLLGNPLPSAAFYCQASTRRRARSTASRTRTRR